MAAVGGWSGELSKCAGLHSQEERPPREEEAWYRFEGSHGLCGCVGEFTWSWGSQRSSDARRKLGPAHLCTSSLLPCFIFAHDISDIPTQYT